MDQLVPVDDFFFGYAVNLFLNPAVVFGVKQIEVDGLRGGRRIDLDRNGNQPKRNGTTRDGSRCHFGIIPSIAGTANSSADFVRSGFEKYGRRLSLIADRFPNSPW